MFSMLVVLTSWIASKMFATLGQGSGTGDPATDPPAPPANEGRSAPADPPPAQTFTQADLDRVAGRTRDEERRKAETALAEQLGVPVDEAKAIIDAKRASDDQQKTEAQRAREEADRERDNAKAERAAAAEEKRQARAERALLGAGVNLDKMGRATTLLLADVTDTEDADKLKAGVESLKADVPGLFGTAVSGAPSSDPSGQPPSNGNGAPPKGMAAGRERARKDIERETKSDDPFAGMSMIGGSK